MIRVNFSDILGLRFLTINGDPIVRTKVDSDRDSIRLSTPYSFYYVGFYFTIIRSRNILLVKERGSVFIRVIKISDD